MVTLNGSPIPVLTYDQVKAAKDALKRLENKDLDIYERTDAAVEVLTIAVPGFNPGACAPGALLKAAMDLYIATFSRPESDAPGDPTEKSTGAISQA